MRRQQTEFAEFFRASWDPCLRAVTAVTGSPQLAEEQVAEAFARAWASWRKVGGHPAPQAWVVRTALNAGSSWWRWRSRELPLADHDLPVADDLGEGATAALTAPRVGHTIAFGMSDNKLKPVDNRLAGHLGFHPQDSSEPFSAGVEAAKPPQDPKAPATKYLGGWFVDLGHPDDKA